ncbi:MAG: hypothetical protein NVSMB3_04540 [Acidobacteriaceae bacterium]
MPASTSVKGGHESGREGLRIAAFASFFKRYMSVSTIVAASVPIPVAALKLIPMYAQQRGFLSVYASLFCFLLVAFLFSVRHQMAAHMFGRVRGAWLLALLPAVFILLTMGCIAGYHATLDRSLQQWRELGVTAPSAELLNKADYLEIPYSLLLSACYLGIFVFAEIAFVLMALREYLQDVLQLEEVELLRGRRGAGKTPPSDTTSSAKQRRPRKASGQAQALTADPAKLEAADWPAED